jgi:hypothetical protein
VQGRWLYAFHSVNMIVVYAGWVSDFGQKGGGTVGWDGQGKN